MGHTLPTNNIFCTNHQDLLNTTNHLLPEYFHCRKAARNLLKKKIISGNIIHKLRKKTMQPVHMPYCKKVCKKQLIATAIPMPTSTILTSCYPYQHDYPITMSDWHPLVTPLLTASVPVIIPTSSPIFATNITPLVGTVVQPVLSTILPQNGVQEDLANILNYTNVYNFPSEHMEGMAYSNQEAYYIQEVTAQTDTTILNSDIPQNTIEIQSNQGDPIESYLNLPKELFPTPGMLALDPNPLIDEFCKMPNLQRHMPWLLDLEFGIPKSPITRPIPTYNVKFNSINCKNAPDAIHPGFESCDPDFKKVLLFYYDCIVSAWYRGYMIMQCDRSVENFQSWLLLPMQVLGMCWP